MTDPDLERPRAFEAMRADADWPSGPGRSGSPDTAGDADSRTAGAATAGTVHRVSSTVAPDLRRLLQRLSTLGDGAVAAEAIAERLGSLLVPALADICVVEVRYADGSRQIVIGRDIAFPSAATRRIERGARVVAEGLPVTDDDGHPGRPRLQHATNQACLRFLGSGDGIASEDVQIRFGSAIIAPLAVGNDLVGSLSLFRGAHEPRFTESDVDLAEIAAALGAAAMRRASARVVETSRPDGIAGISDGTHDATGSAADAGRASASINVAERQREMERLAQIGAIYSGLGHDLGNLLLPLRLRLDSLRRIALPPDGEADLSAIETAVSYLQQLETGLGWLAAGCNPSGDAVTSTRLRGWAVEIEPILRHALPEAAILTIDIPPRLPAIGISRPALTQAVFNLVQNAGHALRGRSDGRVVLGARRERDGKTMHIFVRDNGPGLDEEAKRRCFEPFYSCRKPGESGGLGLAIVRALARSAGGDVTVLSEAGAGATFTLAIPIARTSHEHRRSPSTREGLRFEVLEGEE